MIILFVQFSEDVWLMFDNCWTYNKKDTRVYKMGLKLSEVFNMHIDDAMKNLEKCLISKKILNKYFIFKLWLFH